MIIKRSDTSSKNEISECSNHIGTEYTTRDFPKKKKQNSLEETSFTTGDTSLQKAEQKTSPELRSTSPG